MNATPADKTWHLDNRIPTRSQCGFRRRMCSRGEDTGVAAAGVRLPAYHRRGSIEGAVAPRTDRMHLAERPPWSMMPELRRVWAMMSLVLAALWLPTSSHPLLESLSLIHDHPVDHIDHSDHQVGHHHLGHHHHHEPSEGPGGNDLDGHDLADGVCRAESGGVRAPALNSGFVHDLLWAAVMCIVDTPTSDLRRAGPSPPGSSPPEWTRTWRFSSRAALPARAPTLSL